MEDLLLDITDLHLAQRSGNLKFYSATYRLFKLPERETALLGKPLEFLQLHAMLSAWLH